MQAIQYKIGPTLGWKAPYGDGVDFSILAHGLMDLNIGCGYSITGARVGLGSRIYPLRDRKITPMIGLFVSFASGEGLLFPANYGNSPTSDYEINLFLQRRSKPASVIEQIKGYLWNAP